MTGSHNKVLKPFVYIARGSFFCPNKLQLIMLKKWILKDKIPQAALEKLSEFEEFARQLLYERGILDANSADIFLHPEYEKMHDPFLFQDMAKATERIWQAIENNEKICIYGDYDADAVTANAVLQQTFCYLGAPAESYIPDRFTEGYGVNLEALEKIKANGVKIIITVDCGTNSLDAAEFCKANGIDFIITDHHEIIGETPQAFALINPKNLQDKYPYREITGVGVAFKLACALLKNEKLKIRAEKLGVNLNSDWAKWLLDLVAIGTVADCHSLMGENRILVKYGLKVLTKTKWIGLKALCQAAGLDFTKKNPDTFTLGYVVAPRLNAAGRLEHADIALHLLLENNSEKAAERAARLELINLDRQRKTEVMVSEAREQVLLLQDRKVLVLMKDDWHKGVVGLIAGRIAEEFRRPAIVMQKGEVESTGSARTVGEFNVVEALKHASEHLIRFGGHQQAAGLTLKTAEHELFYEKILQYAETNLNESDTAKILSLDAELQETDLSVKILELLEQFEPFGVGNNKPKFLISNLNLVSFRLVGTKKQHVQCQFKKGSRNLSAIGFNMAALVKSFSVGDTVDVAAEIMEDGWNGRKDIKLRMIDMRKSISEEYL